ncbi:cupin domain-containing protein [Flavobacterium ardleyense]|uniref:cupin domain-containing protein n=1 Tax=Flavobacterium ardleyense TaxID=2038737 RepID=UPI00298C6A3B|nr:cupin domain-containing protein [Flavobacterium ardleyense]
MKNYFIQSKPFVVPTTDGKHIEEHHGLATTNNKDLSIAFMIAPPGWSEPFQKPDFDEYTFIIKGRKQFIVDGDVLVLESGQSIKIGRGAQVQYSNPFDEACEYLSICTPAFSIHNVNRDLE